MTVADGLRYNLENGIDSREITIEKNGVTESVRGLCSFHNLNFDENGMPINDTNIRMIVSIQTLLEKFDLYKKDDFISMKGFDAKFKTVNDREIITRIKNTIPDYNRGTISLICEFKRNT